MNNRLLPHEPQVDGLISAKTWPSLGISAFLFRFCVGPEVGFLAVGVTRGTFALGHFGPAGHK